MNEIATTRTKIKIRSFGSLARWSDTNRRDPYSLLSRNHGHRTGALEKHGEHPTIMVPHQGGHRHHWRNTVAADTHHTHLSEVLQPSLFPKRRLEEGYDTKGIAAAQQSWGFHPGSQGEGDGGNIPDGASRKVSGARGRHRGRSRHSWLWISPGRMHPSPAPTQRRNGIHDEASQSWG